LTPERWVVGKLPPSDRVETWSCFKSKESASSTLYIDWECKWANERISRSERDELRRKHDDVMGVAGRSGDTITTIGDPL